MIPCYRTHGSRYRINIKSIKEEYKIWVLNAEAYGYVVHFRPYQGAKKGKQVASYTKGGLGKNVLRLIECSTPPFSFHIFMDNYFTSFRLLTHFGVNNIQATGVVNQNRFRKCTIIVDNLLQKKECDHSEQRISSKKSIATLIRTTAGHFT